MSKIGKQMQAAVDEMADAAKELVEVYKMAIERMKQDFVKFGIKKEGVNNER